MGCSETTVRLHTKSVHTRMPVVAAAVSCVLLGACQPTVKVEAPKEPITINLNVKLDAEVRVKLEEQAQEDIAKNDEIF